jgi:hypothetical protein
MSNATPASTPTWDLTPGDVIRRVDLHDRYGGSRQGGIGPSAKSPNVFVLSDPERGHQHGYFDGWKADGCFHYTGEGQRGDQQMEGGNKAILDHRQQGRALRVFQGVGGTVTYQGEFEVATDRPWYQTDAPESGNPDVIRQVIVFRLRPLDTSPPAGGQAVDAAPKATLTEVPVEEQNTERVYVQPSHEPYEAERREQKLVREYMAYMATKGSRIVRHRMQPEGEAKPIFSDVYDVTRHQLIEAQGHGHTRGDSHGDRPARRLPAFPGPSPCLRDPRSRTSAA